MQFVPFSPIPLDHDQTVADHGRSALRRIVVAVLAVAVAVLVRLALHPMLGETMAYTLFMPAVLVAAGYGGFGPGLVALLLSGVAGNYFFQKPYGTFALETTPETVRFSLSLLAGLLICIMGGRLERSRRRAIANAGELLRQSQRFRSSEENYRRLFETAYEGICCLDEDEHVIYVNGRMVDMIGYSIIGMVGHPISEFVFPEDWERLKSVLESRRKGGKQVFDFRLRRKNGTPIFCIVSTQSIFDREGRYRGSLNMVTDITARRLSAEDINQLFDQLKLQVKSILELEQAVLERLNQRESGPAQPVQQDNVLDDARQAIARSIELTRQLSSSLRSGKSDEPMPASASSGDE